METEINIAEILKDKPEGTKLWTDMFGSVTLYVITDACDAFQVKHHYNKEPWFDKDGKFCEEGVLCIYPSKSMRDWSKFAWKKGDVLVSNDSTTKVIFNGWKDDTYTLFRGAYALITHNDGKVEFGSDSLIFETCNYKGIEVEDDAQFYINYIERKLGGKLNLETLEIENAHPEFKDGDILCVIDNSNDYNYILIYEGQDDKHIHRYVTMFEDNSLNIKKDSYLTKPEDYSMHYATYEEKQQLFDALAKEGKAWDAKKKQIVNLKPKADKLKPFDKVLVRNDKEDQWSANIFSYQVRDNMYYCLGECYWRYCIPYKGNESLLGTTKDVEG